MALVAHREPSPSTLAVARLSEGGVALVVNPRAKRVRKGTADPRQLRAQVELHGHAYEPRSLAELAESALEIRARDPGLVAICGGDGTYQKTLSALIEAYAGHPLPLILPLQGGTFCVLTQALALKGSAAKVLARAMSRVRDMRRAPSSRRAPHLRITTIPIVEVFEQRSGKREYAFLFANGVISRVIARYAEGPPSPARAARVFSEAVGGFIMQTPAGREFARRHVARVTVDGRVLPDDRLLGVLAGTIPPNVLGFTPFVVKKRLLRSFKYAAGMVDASEVIGMLPALLRGKLWSTHPGLRNGIAHEITIASDEGYILDGEVYPSGVPRVLRLRIGPRLRFLRP